VTVSDSSNDPISDDIKKHRSYQKARVTRPLISFPVVAYNQERFIAEAVKGAFSQTYSPLEIILSDDCSTDRTYQIMTEMAVLYNGPHKVILNRNQNNLGVGGHVNRIMELAQGALIVPSAGDDVSLPERVEKVYLTWRATDGKGMSIYSNMISVDDIGNQHGALAHPRYRPDFSLSNMIAGHESVLPGCAHSWSREVFDTFGPVLTPLLREDAVIPFRSALIGDVCYIDECLVLYRRHSSNTITDEDKIRDLSSFIDRIRIWTAEMKAVYINWLRDLSTAMRLFPEREQEFVAYQGIITDSLSRLEKEIALFQTGKLDRIIILAKLLREGISKNRFFFWVGTLLLPSIYRQYLKLKVARQRLNGIL
jgi:glycosyltransferase involved in cell wall biosynthesis